MNLRPYQTECLEKLYAWWGSHPGKTEAPLVVVPTGGGKSVIIAELVRNLWEQWPEERPRTVVIVPSKELAEQNAAKLVDRLPKALRVGYYSASIGRKQPDADVIVATIGSIYKAAHLLGNIRCVIIDEAHLVNPDGAEAGRYRQFLSDLGRYCEFRVVGWTATPFRGNGVWLTVGESPLFTGVAHTVKIGDLMEAGYLSRLVRPVDVIQTQVDTSGVKTTSGDYNLGELSEAVEAHLNAAADESVKLATDRRKWIAFLPTVANAQHFAQLLGERGIVARVVTGDTEKAEREALIALFRAGQIRCLVTVLALATGFDVPDVDCLIWLRPTKSPVLYVQGFGRGLRIADGKPDCLVLDFTDTVARMGPIDAIKGRNKVRRSNDNDGPPVKACDECGELVHLSVMICPNCGYEWPEREVEVREASNAAIMTYQVAKPVLATLEVSRVTYSEHRKLMGDGPTTLRVEYWSGLKIAAREWVCLNHEGWAQEKAHGWWAKRAKGLALPASVQEALSWLEQGYPLAQPVRILVKDGKWPEVVGHVFEDEKEAVE